MSGVVTWHAGITVAINILNHYNREKKIEANKTTADLCNVVLLGKSFVSQLGRVRVTCNCYKKKKTNINVGG